MASADRVELDVSRSEKKLWLVKVPNFLAKRWYEACRDSLQGTEQVGPELGRVLISPGTGQDLTLQTEATCSLQLSGATAEGVPQQYNLRPANESQAGLHAFGSEPGHMNVVGKIDQRFDAEMKQGQAAQGLDPEYRKISRERNRAAETKLRTAQIIAPQNTATRISASPQFARQKRRAQEIQQEKKVVEKRVRMSREDLEALLFRLFERQVTESFVKLLRDYQVSEDYWSFQHLVTETDQPVAWLKEVLLALAIQNKKPGPYRDQWLLKPEYRTREPPPAE